jgi:hypothetical protein
MAEQNFNAIRWLASEVLLRRGALERLQVDGIEAYMKGCPFGGLSPEQEATVLALMGNDDAMDGLFLYWEAYTAGRESGEIPDAAARSPWLN